MAEASKRLQFIERFNEKYGTTDKKALANFMLKKGVDVGTAVVNIIGATGIAGFKFNIPESELVKFENEISDHYTDNNSPVQDHIVEKPIEITVTGLVGDYFYSRHIIQDLVAQVVPTLTLVKEFVPQISPVVMALKEKFNIGASSTYNFDPETGVLSGGSITNYSFNLIDLFKLFQNLYKLKSAQTRAFIFFECLWKMKSLFSVETTWKRYDNMLVKSLEAKRDKNLDITEFSLTFKQMSFTQSLLETPDEYKTRLSMQNAPMVNKGVEEGTEVSVKEN